MREMGPDVENCVLKVMATWCNHQVYSNLPPQYELIMGLNSDEFVSLFDLESVKKRMLRVTLPKSIKIDDVSMLIRLHMKMFGAPHYIPVNMFIVILNRSTLSDDFTFHLSKIFIQGGYSIEKFWLEFWLEKRIDIPF